MTDLRFRIWSKSLNRFVTYVEDDQYRECYLSIGLLGGLGATDKYGEELNIDDDNFIISQFTGLTDISNRQIFEGDLLKVYNYDTIFVSPVTFEIGCFGVTNNRVFKNISFYPDVEIIGNIYERH